VIIYSLDKISVTKDWRTKSVSLYNGDMNANESKNNDSDFADLILIMQSLWEDEDGDKFWDKNKDWLLDDDGNKVYL
jgi:hypothetical protein